MREDLNKALAAPLWTNHKIGDTYFMDGQSWKISYYPIFEDGRSGKIYDEPRALVERESIFNGVKGIDFREVPLRYLIKPVRIEVHTRYAFAQRKFNEINSAWGKKCHHESNFINGNNFQSHLKKLQKCNNIITFYRDEFAKTTGIDDSVFMNQIVWINQNKKYGKICIKDAQKDGCADVVPGAPENSNQPVIGDTDVHGQD